MEEKVTIGNDAVTTLLFVNESKPVVQRAIWGAVSFVIAFILAWLVITPGGFTIADIILIVVLTLYGFFWASGRNKYHLCVEGVGFPGRGSRLYKWNSFTGFTIDDSRKRFRLNKAKGYLDLQTVKEFDEAKKIISQNIPPNNLHGKLT